MTIVDAGIHIVVLGQLPYPTPVRAAVSSSSAVDILAAHLSPLDLVQFVSSSAFQLEHPDVFLDEVAVLPSRVERWLGDDFLTSPSRERMVYVLRLQEPKKKVSKVEL